MNKQIRQLIKSSKRKIIFVTEPGDKISELVGFIKSLGFIVYRDPTDYEDFGSLIISNQKITYADYIVEYKKMTGDAWWAAQTFSCRVKQELDIV